MLPGMTAELDGDFAVFLIGARFNNKLHLARSLLDLGGRRGMKHMLDYLVAHPDKGLLGFYLFTWPTRPPWPRTVSQAKHAVRPPKPAQSLQQSTCQALRSNHGRTSYNRKVAPQAARGPRTPLTKTQPPSKDRNHTSISSLPVYHLRPVGWGRNPRQLAGSLIDQREGL